MIPLSDDAPRLKTTPLVTYLLILSNIVIYFVASETHYDLYSLRAGDIMSGVNLLTLVTSTFLHLGFFHLLFNMWSLWIFGDNVEDDLGTLSYIFLYLTAGITGGIVFALTANQPDYFAVGASGAISGIMGAYLVMHHRNRVLTLIPLGIIFTTIKINAPIFIGLWFLIQFAGFSLAADSGVAYSAHVGGFVTGVVLAFLLKGFKKQPRVEVVN
jgi:membrane associated rhomboid family serine protease